MITVHLLGHELVLDGPSNPDLGVYCCMRGRFAAGLRQYGLPAGLAHIFGRVSPRLTTFTFASAWYIVGSGHNTYLQYALIVVNDVRL